MRRHRWPLLVFGLAFLLAAMLERAYRRSLDASERARVTAAANRIGAGLSTALNQRVVLLHGLRAFVEVNFDRPGFRADFLAYAERLQGSLSGIRSVQWVKDGIIQESYPLTGNERAIGYNLLTDSRDFIREDYLRAERSPGVVISGPTDLVQGGVGLIARAAAHRADGSLLAVVAVVLDLPSVLSEAGIAADSTLRIALRTPRGGAISGAPMGLEERPVVVPIRLADGEWEMAVAPASGWGAGVLFQLMIARIALALSVLVIGMGAALLVGRSRARLQSLEARERLLGQEKFSRLFQLSPVGAFLTRMADGTIVEVNQAAEAILGYSRGELVGQTMEALGFWATEPDAASPVPTVSELIHRDGVVQNLPGRFRHRAGQLRDVLYSGRGLEMGGEPHLLSLFRDVTEAKELQAQLAHSQKLEAVGRLAGGVAHDFNNVITAISGYAQLLSASIPPHDPRHADAEEIIKGAKRAARLTQQLLAFARRQIVQPRLLDLNRLIHDVTRLVRPLVGGQVELVLDLAAEPVVVLLDVGQFEQVLVNLVINARDAMPGGGMMTIRTRLDEADAVLEVADTGQGMTEAVRERAFEPFFTTKEPGRGTGLGLATVHGIVEQAGGRVSVDSAVGQGARFTIRLPRARGTPLDDPLVAAATSPPSGTGRILLVEDEPQVRRLAARALSGAGYQVVSAEDAEEALRHLQLSTTPFDLLLTDLVMPGLGGHDLAREFHSRLPGVAVLFMSGYTGDAATRQGMLEAGQNFLPKPFTPAELVARVREILEARSVGGP